MARAESRSAGLNRQAHGRVTSSRIAPAQPTPCVNRLRDRHSKKNVGMPVKTQNSDEPLTGPALIKETCRRIRVARSYWDAHNNRACRGEREKAIALYDALSEAERKKVPQALRVWLRYRSEKYFGVGRTPPGGSRQ